MISQQAEKAKRIAPRTGSFADFEQEVGSQEHHIELSSANGGRSAQWNSGGSEADPAKLLSENEKLRQQIEDLQSQVIFLRHHYHQQQQESRRNSNGALAPPPGVILELPKAMQGGVQLNCLKSKRGPSVKDHQSSTTDDDQSTIEPSREWEMHESMSGLKQRHHLPESPQRQKSKLSGVDGSRRSVPFSSSNDDSLSSEEGGEGDEEEGGMEAESRQLIRRSTSHEVPVRNPSNTEDEPFWRSVSDRAGWLVGLLVLQSMSSFILGRNEKLLQKHSVIVRFLTMLVGAGGNAGNQASVRVIRGLAVGTIDDSNQKRHDGRGVESGPWNGWVYRAAIFLTPLLETVAITASLFMIVIISIVLGAMMPLGLKMIGIDPAHSSTTIQVVMDILGVSITVW
eukprot:CAMPEP_0176148042 /NCGR_PEP_ID=MMETSP0120_2-20121206/75483_1 /TAXON_ID=160619 /ORGANISM="Kryptoperidinium foliaceum, Strain CCMP 1326" /LENGTH=397 /DNA_ID=CAMNT_0017484699 /DNA_START=117 /DNA_END=1308 /DNA_ORIENTATION=+